MASAQYPTNGFYRVQNYGTGRFAYVLDNTGSIDYSTTSADMGAIELHRDTARLHYDPASVIFARIIDNASHKYDLEAQGTGVFDLIQHYVQTSYQSDTHTFKVYATSSGFSKYLSEMDSTNSAREESYLSTERKGVYRLWTVIPFGADGDYFGILPTMQLGQKYYRPFYASFTVVLPSSGMRAFYIKQVHRNAAILEELHGTIPAYTPVYIECSGAHAWENKVDILEGSRSGAVSGNKLKGNFFRNFNRRSSRDALVAYNPVVMRVLTTTPDGQLCFAKASGLSYLPANEAYLEVPATAEDTLLVMTEAEYQVYSTATSIQLADDSISLYMGATRTLQATILPSTVEIQNAAWSSTDPQVVSVDNTGKCTATGIGTAYVVARTQDGSNLADSCLVRVLPVLTTHITITPTNYTADPGDSTLLTATVFPANATDKTLLWSSTGHGAASVENGLVRIIGYGTDTITATATDGSGVFGQCVVTGRAPMAQSITLRIPEIIYVGDSFTPGYTLAPAGATGTIYQWKVNNRGTIVSINESTGLCTAVKAGSFTITAYVTAADGHRFTGQISSRVLNRPAPAQSFDISADTIMLQTGTDIPVPYSLLPEGSDQRAILWQIADTTIAGMNGTTIRGITPGTTMLTATLTDGSGLSDSCVIIVSTEQINTDTIPVETISIAAESAIIYAGDTLQLTATITPYNATDRGLIWSSSDTEVLIVDQNGLCHTTGIGSATITATAADGHGASGTISIIVEPVLVSEIILSRTEIDCIAGDTIHLHATVLPHNATEKTLFWTSSDTTILSVDGNGICTTLRPGRVTVSAVATDSSMLSATCQINVSPIIATSLTLSLTEGGNAIEETELTIGTERHLYAVIGPTNVSGKEVVWESSDNAVLTVENGLVSAVGIGEADIICTTLDASMLSARCHIRVLPIFISSITLSATSLSLYEDERAILSATIAPADATIKTLLWTSSDSRTAVVSDDGHITAIASGTTIITAEAQDGSNVSASCELEVKKFTSLEDIVLNPQNHIIYDIMGRRVAEISRGGLYIIDGKTIFVTD